MSSSADDFRAEARKMPGHVAKRKIGGWTFCLSYGSVDPKEAVSAIDAGMVIEVESLGDKTKEVVERLRAWTPEDQAVAEREMAGEWMLSAKTVPPDRTPTEKELAFLGRTLAALHVPAETEQPTAVRGTRQWIWKDS
jgi:hypothetical protein